MFAASIALDQHDVAAAVSHLLEFDDIIRPLRQDEVLWGDRRRPLLEWARVAVAVEKPDVAVRLLAAAEAHSKSHGEPTWPPYLAEFALTRTAAEEQLDESRFGVAWTEGLSMTADAAVDYAVAELASLATSRDESL